MTQPNSQKTLHAPLSVNIFLLPFKKDRSIFFFSPFLLLSFHGSSGRTKRTSASFPILLTSTPPVYVPSELVWDSGIDPLASA